MVMQQKTYTATDFWQMAETLDDTKRYELREGNLVEMNPPSRKHSWIAAEIAFHLKTFVKQHDLGYVFGADGGYTLSADTVVLPDASFVSRERMPVMADVETILAPDLAVEVISPSETPRAVHDKTALYLNAGTPAVGNVYPDDTVIEVWQGGDAGKFQMQTFGAEDTLDGGGNVLPGFSLPVKDILPA